MICYKDVFKATISVVMFPENLKTAFDISVTREADGYVHDDPPMLTTTTSFDYAASTSFTEDGETLNRTVLGRYRMEVLGIDPLWRTELDLTKVHTVTIPKTSFDTDVCVAV